MCRRARSSGDTASAPSPSTPPASATRWSHSPGSSTAARCAFAITSCRARTMTGSERRLHPLTLLFDIGGDLRQVAIPLVIVFFVSQSRSGGTQLVAPLIVLLITAAIAVARYVSYSYRYDASELVIRSG